MIYRKLGQSGLNGSVLQMGTYQAASENPRDPADREFKETILKAVEMGINVFDTAESYGNGRAERVLGEALKGIRDKVLIAGKVKKETLHYQQVLDSCEASLKRLGTDYLDILYIHIPNPEIPIEETMEALVKLKEAGKIRLIAVSNFTVPELEAAGRIGRIDMVQNCYNMLWRWMEKDVIPYCVKNEIAFATYSPLVQGILSGKYTQDLDIGTLDDRGRVTLFRKEWFGKCLAVTEGVKYVAKKYGKTPSQVAINWVLSQKGVNSVVFGAKSVKQLQDNLDAVGWEIDRSDMGYLDRLTRTVTDDLPHNISIWW